MHQIDHGADCILFACACFPSRSRRKVAQLYRALEQFSGSVRHSELVDRGAGVELIVVAGTEQRVEGIGRCVAAGLLTPDQHRNTDGCDQAPL